MKEFFKSLNAIEKIGLAVFVLGIVLTASWLPSILYALFSRIAPEYPFTRADLFSTALSFTSGGWKVYFGLVFFISGLAILYKKKTLVKTKKDICNSFILVFVIGAIFSLLQSLSGDIKSFLVMGSPSIALTLMIQKLIGVFGWTNHVSFLIVVAGFFYLYSQYKQKVPANEQVYEVNTTDLIEEEKHTLVNKHLSVGKWFWTIFLLGIPIVNFILLLVWGFGPDSPRKNFSLAVLLYSLIAIILTVIVVLLGMLSS
ncbi:hypothetical protein [Bacillus sp. FJAT-27445]|uniref:hypothetical protein n=1 Tax=Bacillus sp. FJAT-27445 TaxID=1679166 RepID=UPI0007444A99|nr:hypothetical protein [Bacillus sp. FJAT-27445]